MKIEVILLLASITITILQLVGPIQFGWAKGSNRPAFVRGMIVVLVIMVTICFSIIKFAADEIQKNESRLRQQDTYDKVDETLRNLEKTNTDLQTFSLQMDSLNGKTQKVIERRTDALTKLDKLNDKIEKAYVLENLKLREGAPRVVVFESVMYRKPTNSENYHLTFQLVNIGERMAQKLDIGVAYFALDEMGQGHYQISTHKIYAAQASHEDALSPQSRGGGKFTLDFRNVPRRVEADSVPIAAMQVFYTYEDIVTDLIYRNLYTYVYLYKGTQNRTWRSGDKNAGVLIEKYLKETNTPLTTASGRVFELD